jgi:hypothetical protein
MADWMGWTLLWQSLHALRDSVTSSADLQLRSWSQQADLEMDLMTSSLPPYSLSLSYSLSMSSSSSLSSSASYLLSSSSYLLSFVRIGVMSSPSMES